MSSKGDGTSPAPIISYDYYFYYQDRRAEMVGPQR
jgi:hypothetical protein